ncbi:hypothetical protein [Shewanella marina]|uniref:hypothetical protein n=1 Tax=Shewanella marina TaxID=487319 RepID=UPI000AC047A1|nr:hypothetical protein [Shewanella marina]
MDYQSKKSLAYYGVSLAVCLTPLTVTASSIAHQPSTQSYTGLMFVPNAQVINKGDASISYHQGVPFRGKIDDRDDWFFATGIMPGLEIGGRIVVKNYTCNEYFTDEDCNRDLSASAKWQLPYIYDWTGFNLAVGIQDIGGAAITLMQNILWQIKNLNHLIFVSAQVMVNQVKV